MTATTADASTALTPASLREDARVMGLVGLAHGSSHFGHMLLPPLFPVFMSEFDLSFAQVGALMTVFFIISGIGQALAGFVVDKFGARPVLFAALTTFVLACAVASMARSYEWLMAAAALAGLANCPFHPVDFTILNQRVSNARLAHAFSVHGLTGSLGWALAPPLFVGLMLVMPWRQAYLVAMTLYLVVIAILFVQRSALVTETVVRKTDAPTGDQLAFLKQPVIWWCFGFFLLSTMTLAMVQSFMPSILKIVHGVSLERAMMTLTAYLVFSAVGMLMGGFVASKLGSERSDRIVAMCMATGAGLLMVAATGWLGANATMMAVALTGFAIGVGGPSRDLMIKRATPKGSTGRVYGTVYSGLDTGFAMAPIIFGAMMDHGLHSATMAGGAVALLLATMAALGVGTRTRRAA